MRVVLVHNAKAGDEEWSRRDLVKLLERAGYKPRYFDVSDVLEKPTRLDRGEFVVVAGGDGAVRKVALALLGRDRFLAPLPLGTANNIARSFGLRGKIEEIVAGWKSAIRRPFDVGVARGPWGARRFVEGVGIGLISRCIAVIQEIDDVSVYAFEESRDKLHRDVCVATALAHEMQPLPTHLILDGRDASNDFLLLEILNIRRAGPGVELALRANPSDGHFDVVSVTARQRTRLIHRLKARLTGTKHLRSLTTRRARNLELGVDRACKVRIDDETVSLAAGDRVEIAIEPGALEFVLPGP